MPTTASHDTIDDAAFEAQLSNFDGSAHSTGGELRPFEERLNPFDKAFPFADADARPAAGSARNPPEFHPMHADAEARLNRARTASRPTGDHVARRTAAPAFAVAVTIVLGLAVGATAATFVFYDRAAQLIATWTNR
jgi:hypothetical protein